MRYPTSQPARNTLRTQERIIDAAHAEFSTVGFDAAQLDRIAHNAKVSRPLVYKYFGSKEELFGVVLDREADIAHGLLSAIDYDNAPVLDVLRSFVTTVFDSQKSAAAVLTTDAGLHEGAWVTGRSRVRPVTEKFLLKLRGVFDRGKAEGLLHDTANAQDFYALSIVVIAGAITFRRLISNMLNCDYHSDTAMVFWRAYVADVMLRSVLRFDHRPDTESSAAAVHLLQATPH
jgi:TetR/AcrR family transcriptional regulator